MRFDAAGDLDRLLDEGHARLVAVMATRLRDLGWEVRLEVTYESGRSSGSIDILAWHPPTSHLLVIEIKTEIPSAEATLRKLDEKVRVASAVAMERFGWSPGRVSRLLVVRQRRRIDAESSRTDRSSTAPSRSAMTRCAPGCDGQLMRSTVACLLQPATAVLVSTSAAAATGCVRSSEVRHAPAHVRAPSPRASTSRRVGRRPWSFADNSTSSAM